MSSFFFERTSNIIFSRGAKTLSWPWSHVQSSSDNFSSKLRIGRGLLCCRTDCSALKCLLKVTAYRTSDVLWMHIFLVIKYIFLTLTLALKLNNITIAFLWVSGHSNIQGNEQVGRLANTASVNGNSLDLPIGNVNSIIKNRALISRALTYFLFYLKSQMRLVLKK